MCPTRVTTVLFASFIVTEYGSKVGYKNKVPKYFIYLKNETVSDDDDGGDGAGVDIINHDKG